MKIVSTVAILALTMTAAFGQARITPTDEKKANETQNKPMTNCPKDEKSNAQSVENSAIVPNAEGHDKSAAPTAQRNNKTVEVDPSCAQDPKKAN